MRAAAEAMVEALLVVDVEARRLFVVERAAGLELAPGALSLVVRMTRLESVIRARSSSSHWGVRAIGRNLTGTANGATVPAARPPPFPSPETARCRSATLPSVSTRIGVGDLAAGGKVDCQYSVIVSPAFHPSPPTTRQTSAPLSAASRLAVWPGAARLRRSHSRHRWRSRPRGGRCGTVSRWRPPFRASRDGRKCTPVSGGRVAGSQTAMPAGQAT